jgi:hypothetical protein
MTPARPETDQACRSLLQKAVRRGQIPLLAQVAEHLFERGDWPWLRARLGVIVVEECWPLCTELLAAAALPDLIRTLTLVAQSSKVKGAAGLSSLAYALSEGDRSVLSGRPGDAARDRHIELLAAAIQNPKAFWAEIEAASYGAELRDFLGGAQLAWSRASWPWDKACALAAAYLATRSGIPGHHSAVPATRELPLWAALDKHTPDGKLALRRAAYQLKLPADQLAAMSFYCEGALANEQDDSYWWSREVGWRLASVGLTLDQAEYTWRERARPLIAQLLEPSAANLQARLAAPPAPARPASPRYRQARIAVSQPSLPGLEDRQIADDQPDTPR